MSRRPSVTQSAPTDVQKAPRQATAAMVLGLISLPASILAGIPAVIFGHIALSKIKKSGIQKGKCMAISGLVLGYLSIVVVPILLFAGASAAMIPDRKSQSANTAHNLRNAMDTYFTEYRRSYPLVVTKSGYAVTDEIFMAGLLAAESEVGRHVNPRGIAFFSARAARPGDNGKWRDGLSLNNDGSGKLWDSWGNLYRIKVDEDEILVWSLGPDGKNGTKDDINTK